jgi:hypothetical protein
MNEAINESEEMEDSEFMKELRKIREDRSKLYYEDPVAYYEMLRASPMEYFKSIGLIVE